MENRQNSTNINWYPGHMEKTKREIIKLLPLIDFVLELVDARIPLSSKVQEIDEIIKNKPRLLVMTKKDLCDRLETDKWIDYYKKLGEKVILVDLKCKEDYKILLKSIEDFSNEINEKRKNKGLKPKEIRGLVMGIPNVGKSTLINTLAKKNKAGVGNIPGFTKSLSWIKAGSTLLLDSPGILWPKLSHRTGLNLASMSAIKQEILPLDEVAKHILTNLDTYYNEILKARYGIEHFNPEEIEDYDAIARKLGSITKGGEPDYDRMYLTIINDIKNELVKGITFDRWK